MLRFFYDRLLLAYPKIFLLVILLAIAGGIAEQGAGLLPDEMFDSLVSELGKLGALPDILLQTGGKLLEAGTAIYLLIRAQGPRGNRQTLDKPATVQRARIDLHRSFPPRYMVFYCSTVMYRGVNGQV